MRGEIHRFGEAEQHNARTLIELACAEDLANEGDVTSTAIIPQEADGTAMVVVRRPGVLCGMPIVAMLAERFELKILEKHHQILIDGSPVWPGGVVCEIQGRMRAMLAFERTALNFLQHLSGIASLTAQFVEAVRGTGAGIFDTRKTTPGWRTLEKYAVRCGGGHNHRIGLFDAVLIKDNHLAFLAHTREPIGEAVGAARLTVRAGTVIEVEVTTLEQLEQALACDLDVILLDNMPLEMIAEAVRRRNARAPRIKLEASGGVSLHTVLAIAACGVDRISVGALTHSAPALDIAFEAVDKAKRH